MKANIFLCQALLCFSSICFGQDTIKVEVSDLVKINFLYPGVSYEKRISKSQTLYVNAYVLIAPSGLISEFGSPDGVYIAPDLTLQYRYYYNGLKRYKNGKRTDKNSMNYMGMLYDVFYSDMPVTQWTKEPRARLVHTAGLVWGMQRNYAKHFSLGLDLGPGFTFAKETDYWYFGPLDEMVRTKTIFTLIASVSLGFWIGREP